MFPARDGYVVFTVQGGWGAGTQSTQAALKWMKEDGMAPEWLLSFDWARDYDLATMTNETMDALEQPFVDFFATKTKAEISERGVQSHFMVGAVNNCKDLANHAHLGARGFFEQAWDEELGEMVTYCGPPVKSLETPLMLRRRPPHIGEHNREIYCQELGISTEKLSSLMRDGAL